MGNKALVYKQKATDNLNESYKHLLRLENAFEALKQNYTFPITAVNILNTIYTLKNDLKESLDAIARLLKGDF